MVPSSAVCGDGAGWNFVFIEASLQLCLGITSKRLAQTDHDVSQVKQLLYGPARRQRLGAEADASSVAMEKEQESALLSELAEGDFSADQNIVEVRFFRVDPYTQKHSGHVVVP